MPILKPNAAPTVEVNVALARTLWQWLGLGALAVVLWPAARGDSALLGFLPFWLLLAPGIALVALYRHALTAAWRARLVRATPRRRRRSKNRGQSAFILRRATPSSGQRLGKINAL